MNRPSRALARANELASADPYRLAYALLLYRKAAGITEEQLAAFLECEPGDLALLALWPCPGADSGNVDDDLDRLTARFGLNRSTLAAVVRAYLKRYVTAPENR